MRKSFAILAALGLAAFLASAASAGTLTGASLQVTVLGTTATFTASSAAAGSSTATTATLDAGSAFWGTATITGVQGYSTVHVFLSDNGALAATKGGAVSITAPITGRAFFGLLSNPILVIPISAAGSPGTPTGFVTGVQVTVHGSYWHVGQVTTTGFFNTLGSPQTLGTVLSTTTGGKKRIRVATTGSFNLTANGAGSVKLVTLNHVIASGLISSDTVTPTVLTLTYAAPEPGTLLLLGAGIAGMLAAGRRRRA